MLSTDAAPPSTYAAPDWTPQGAGADGSAGSPARALLLNASLEPLCVVSLRRAVVLVMTGKATILESEGRMLHSERAALPVPVVLSLTRYVHVPVRRAVPPTRRTVLQRDNHRCAYCGGGADTVDHVLPRSRGGRHEWTNVVAAWAMYACVVTPAPWAGTAVASSRPAVRSTRRMPLKRPLPAELAASRAACSGDGASGRCRRGP